MPSSRAASATAWAWLPDENATTPAPAGQRGDLRVRAAELERAGALKALGLEHHVSPSVRDVIERRAVRDAVEHARRRPDVVGPDHATGSRARRCPRSRARRRRPAAASGHRRARGCTRCRPSRTRSRRPAAARCCARPARAGSPTSSTGRADCRASAPRRSRARSSRPSAPSNSSGVTTTGPSDVAKSLPFAGPSPTCISRRCRSRADQSLRTVNPPIAPSGPDDRRALELVVELGRPLRVRHVLARAVDRSSGWRSRRRESRTTPAAPPGRARDAHSRRAPRRP